MPQRRTRRPDPLALAITFLEEARLAGEPAELAELLAGASRDLGFDHYALVHHADLARPARGLIRIDNYPDAWRRHFVEAALYAVDPVQQASLSTNVGFLWSQVPEMIRLSARQREIFALGARAGLGTGFTVPAHVPGERNGSCSFAAPPGKPIPATALVAAQAVGAAAFAAARRLTGSAERDAKRVALSRRQRECLLLVAQGKSDWETARILGLSEETVTNYVNAARDRYGVSRRVQLAIGAIFDGEISFAEVLSRQ